LVPSKFTFNGADYFYYRVKLNYSDFTYEVTDVNGLNRIGGSSNPIKWYEYVNP